MGLVKSVVVLSLLMQSYKNVDHKSWPRILSSYTVNYYLSVWKYATPIPSLVVKKRMLGAKLD